MALTVRRSRGVVIEFGDHSVVFDPASNSTRTPVFVTHAHADHAAAFKHPELTKYATEPTCKLLKTLRGGKLDNWKPLNIGETVKIGEIEVKAHNAGHVLGSVQLEAATPEGNIVYTGDFSLGNSYTMKAAPAVKCDLLIIETTFGAPMFKFPKRKELALEMVRWAVMETIPKGRVPTFLTDSIGNSQEVISMFNNLTKLPVVTAKSVTKASDVYRKYGHRLEYVGDDSSEGKELIDGGRCVLVAPKNSKLNHENLEKALASGWSIIMKKDKPSFPLSDHADFRELLNHIKQCRPKRVLTFHGGKMTLGFADHVRKKLRIDARPLTSREESLMGPVRRRELRIKACYEQLLRSVRIPGFEYSSSWLLREMAHRGFSKKETEAALQLLVNRNILETGSKGFRLV